MLKSYYAFRESYVMYMMTMMMEVMELQIIPKLLRIIRPSFSFEISQGAEASQCALLRDLWRR